MPTQLNCRVELRQWCVLNSQLVGNSLDESEQFADNEVKLRRVGNTSVASRRELVANSIHTADADATPTQFNSTVELRRRCVLGFSVKKV